MTNEKILEEFYNQYFRSPSREEFAKCGGCIWEVIDDYGGYNQFLIENKYEPYHGLIKTYEVFDKEGNSIFVGTVKDVADELGVRPTHVSTSCSKGRRIQRKYTIKEKPFKGYL